MKTRLPAGARSVGYRAWEVKGRGLAQAEFWNAAWRATHVARHRGLRIPSGGAAASDAVARNASAAASAVSDIASG